MCRAYLDVGATHLILGLAAGLGPDRLRVVAGEVAEPILEQFG
jgi:hypothetical protein